jgi:hypothetical protein
MTRAAARRARLVSALIGIGLLCAAVPAVAQNAAEAQRLFDKGKKLYDTERFDAACEAFAESERLEPGVGVLGLLAACHEKQGRIATAYSEYLTTASRARAQGDEREAYARGRAEALERKRPSLTVRGEAVAGLRIASDGEPVELGKRVFLDPGTHRVVASAPGRKPREISVDLAIGEQHELLLPPLDADDTSSAAPKPPARSPEQASTRWDSPRRTIGWIGVGLGGAGVAVGIVAGVVAIGKKGDLELDPLCPDACTDAALVDSYNTTRNVSTVGFIAGGALLAAGVVLVLTAPGVQAAPASAQLRLAPGGATLAGTFW